jgi:hypothetical protein
MLTTLVTPERMTAGPEPLSRQLPNTPPNFIPHLD